jgi:FMN phosphatase YigB (HAD superfamily)
MSLTLLFDLDGTLLDTNLESFTPAYFQALAQHLAHHAAPNNMLRALVAGVNLMYESEDPTHTLQEIFDSDFYPNLGVTREEMEEVIEDFYDNVFPTLSQHAGRRPEAVPLIEWALSRGYRIAIATDPLFPRKATYHRLRWAGFDPDRFELVSSFEHFHFTKTHPAYYAEVLGRLGWPEGPILMVGNDVERDLIPAHRLGLKTFFVHGEAVSSPGFEAGRGKLADLRPWLESLNLSTLEPAFKSRDAILAIMASPRQFAEFIINVKGIGRNQPTMTGRSIIVCHCVQGKSIGILMIEKKRLSTHLIVVSGQMSTSTGMLTVRLS